MAERLLIIEDSMDFLEVLSYTLKAAGFTILSAKTGKEGLETARREQPDLILTDLMLPLLNGYEICSMLKQDGRYARIPIIMLSATKVQERDEQLAKDCGADLFVLKSVDPKDLVQKIRDLLASRDVAR
jgi:two-component system phosphate regulon response regulator PhoB